MAASITVWVLLGLGAGGGARAWYRREDVGWVGAILLGVVGALVGGGAAWFLDLDGGFYQGAGVALAATGALVVLALGFLSAQPRTSF